MSKIYWLPILLLLSSCAALSIPAREDCAAGDTDCLAGQLIRYCDHEPETAELPKSIVCAVKPVFVCPDPGELSDRSIQPDDLDGYINQCEWRPPPD